MSKFETIAVVALVDALKTIAEKLLSDEDQNKIPDIFDSILELFGLGDKKEEEKGQE